VVVFVPPRLARIVFLKPSYGSNRYLATIRPLRTAIEVGPTQAQRRRGQPRTYDALDLGLLAFAFLAAQQSCPDKPKHCSANLLSLCNAYGDRGIPAPIAVMS
jgi:hypothetical protein